MKGILQLSVIPMRATPSDKAEMVNQVLFGETFDVLKQTEKWSKIRLHHDHYEGWIDKKQYAWTKTKNKKEISVVSSLFEKIKKRRCNTYHSDGRCDGTYQTSSSFLN